jgi:hypothetical protein
MAPHVPFPTYPVINPKPTVDDCIKVMGLREVAQVFGITGASWSYGYLLGRPVRFATANTAATLGFTFATFWITQNARKRLIGFAPNEREVKMLGLHPIQPEQPIIDLRSPVARKPHKDISWTKYND